jgi:hypothetical protein
MKRRTPVESTADPIGIEWKLVLQSRRTHDIRGALFGAIILVNPGQGFLSAATSRVSQGRACTGLGGGP